MSRIILLALALTACGDHGLSEAQRGEVKQVAEGAIGDSDIDDTTDMVYDHEARLQEIEEKLGIE